MTCSISEQLSKDSARDVCIFLSDYASWLLGCGATCIRIEKNVDRMAAALDMKADISITPTHIHMSVWDNCHYDSYVNIVRVHKTGISFNINTQLSKLSWDLADGKIDFHTAVETFHTITYTKPENRWKVLVLASVANASFCRLFGGDWIAIGLVFLATFAGYRIKQIMLEHKSDVRLVFVCSAFVSSVIGSGCMLFGWGATPETALGTSVLYLIPGIPYINSVSDMLDGHYICSFSRFIDAVVLTMCLSLGLCLGILLMGLKLF